MEPFPKRQRLYAQIERDFPRSFDSQEVYFDENPEDDSVIEENELEEEEPDEEEPAYDDESVLQEKRARLDYKLKSTFEAIFEKYGRDFEGIGDEIDIATGEIVVNNGHLLEMEDEMDAGDASRSRMFQVESSDELNDGHTASLDETDLDNGDEEDDEETEAMVDDRMMEDDLILRGFVSAQRRIQSSPKLEKMHGAKLSSHYYEQNSGPSFEQNTLPSESQILAQFGPQIGPQILEYIAHQPKLDDSHIEPAWRVPDIPVPKSAKPMMAKKITLPPDEERSPSPEAATSIWAPIKSRARRVDGENKKKVDGRVPFATKYRKDGPVEVPRSRAPNFTKEDDDILRKWASKARRKGTTLTQIFRDLEAKYPHRSWNSWRDRYFRKFTYLSKVDTIEQPDSVEESDLTSETSVYTDQKAGRTQNRRDSIEYEASEFERPIRVRKPAQKDSRIISWQDAVDILDPYEHAEILEDAKMLNLTPKHHGKRIQGSQIVSQEGQRDAQSQKRSEITVLVTQTQQKTTQVNPVKLAPEFENPVIPAVSCPHADCKTNFKTKYKLQPRHDEDVSEMNLHLFTTHHTTPFPCSETDCPRNGDNGYFMQADLVKHVTYAHPGIAALHRLRGRVAPELLDRNILRGLPRDKTQDENRQASQSRDSDFMSASKGFRARATSSPGFTVSNSDPDRTLTPRDGIQQYVTTVTPMTSVSSLRVHHSSITTAPVREISESQERVISDAQTDDESEKVTIGFSHPGIQNLNRRGSFGGMVRSNARKIFPQESHPESRYKEQDLSPNPATSIEYSHEPRINSSTHTEEINHIQGANNATEPKHLKFVGRMEDDMGQNSYHGVGKTSYSSSSTPASEYRPNSNVILSEESKAMSANSSPHEISNDSTGIAEKVTLLPETRSEEVVTPKQPVIIPPQPVQSELQNTTNVPAASIPGPKAISLQEKAVTTPIINLSKSVKSVVQRGKISVPPKPKTPYPSVLPKPLLQTPANPKPRKSILRKLLQSGELDELSLCDEDIILISSRSKANSRLNPTTCIKQEDSTDSPQVSSVITTKKRKLDMFQDNGELDELGLDEDISPTSLATKIKNEVEEISLSSISALTSKGASKEGRTPMAEKLKHINGTATTGTPLLDLTPSGKSKQRADVPREIRDSVEVSSPSMAIGTQSSPIDDLLTPARMKHSHTEFLKANQTIVTIRTPGGTLRRCGDNGLKCKKLFCFRCGSEAGAAAPSAP